MLKQSTTAAAVSIATFARDDLEVGDLLGAGGFCYVVSASLRIGCHDDHPEDGSSSSFSSLHTADDNSHHSSCEANYAVKFIRGSILRCSEKASEAMDDLQREVEILSSLPTHKNIISIRGVSQGFWSCPETGFVVLDRLFESLDVTLQRRRSEALAGWNWLFMKHLTRYSQAKRIAKAMLGAANALKFLHSQKILFRDFKPANLGFGLDGVIRLFDFGLAKCMPLSSNCSDKYEGYLLTGMSGTLRYMAPEVALSEPYGYASDAYSFGMVLWEVCVLDIPYRFAPGKASLTRLVRAKETKPPLLYISSPLVKNLLQACWDSLPPKRPTLDCIHQTLIREVKSGLSDEQKNTKRDA